MWDQDNQAYRDGHKGRESVQISLINIIPIQEVTIHFDLIQFDIDLSNVMLQDSVFPVKHVMKRLVSIVLLFYKMLTAECCICSGVVYLPCSARCRYSM